MAFAGSLATEAILQLPTGGCSDSNGNIYISDTGNNVIRKVNNAGIITTFAGNGSTVYTGIHGTIGDGGPATEAILQPYSICSDSNGNIYITDIGNNVIRKVNNVGIITTFAGNGIAGYSGDGGLAREASIDGAMGVCSDSNGNIYIGDTGNNVIRKVNNAGIITTFAGNGSTVYNGIHGTIGDGGLAIEAFINAPQNICSDSNGNIYITDISNSVIRKVNNVGIITTFAGNGIVAYSGDGGLATEASIALAMGVCSDSNGNIFIADSGNQVIRKVDSVGIITTFAGNGIAGYSGDGGLARNSSMSSPYEVFSDSNDNIYIADSGNNVIRKIDIVTRIITTFAGYSPPTPMTCFLEGTKILTNKGYVPIQNLRNGDLIKTAKNNYKPISMIGKREIYNPASQERIRDQLYRCSKYQYPELFEDLVITGCHAILMDNFKDENQKEKTREVLGDIYITDRKYRIPACLDERASVYENNGMFNIYHIALDNNDYYKNYGIYANNLLVESCSKRNLKELSNMILL
jgi:streptogramin lyase